MSEPRTLADLYRQTTLREAGGSWFSKCPRVKGRCAKKGSAGAAASDDVVIQQVPIKRGKNKGKLRDQKMVRTGSGKLVKHQKFNRSQGLHNLDKKHKWRSDSLGLTSAAGILGGAYTGAKLGTVAGGAVGAGVAGPAGVMPGAEIGGMIGAWKGAGDGGLLVDRAKSYRADRKDPGITGLSKADRKHRDKDLARRSLGATAAVGGLALLTPGGRRAALGGLKSAVYGLSKGTSRLSSKLNRARQSRNKYKSTTTGRQKDEMRQAWANMGFKPNNPDKVIWPNPKRA